MSQKHTYSVVVNEDNFSINLDDLSDFDFISLGDNEYHIISKNKSFKASVESFNAHDKTLVISVNGNKYPLTIKDKYDRLVDKMGLSIVTANQVKDIKAPMPGLVLEIEVEPGQTVEQGEGLLILEAMKMENILKSPGDGVVKSISVNKGDAVEKGQILIEME
jgi:biotin carboxyl carrier protein